MRAGRNLASGGSSMDQDSFDSYTAEDMLVMATEGIHINDNEHELPSHNVLDIDEEELPKSIIVTNVDLSVFDDETAKSEFESLFQDVETPLAFHYLRSFRRVRVDFASNLAAARAKDSLDMTPVGDNIIHCYFIQVLSPCTSEAYLQPPPLEKQFLISPPCSPPVGWEQPREGVPVPLDYDLLAAMAQLAPGETHELHPRKEVTIEGTLLNTPSIVVEVCEELDVRATGMRIPGARPRPQIAQTRCPDRQGSLGED